MIKKIKNKIKLIAIDLDGTLLRSDNSISSKNKKILNIIKENILVILTSARPPWSIAKIQKVLKMEHYPFIAYNGALVVDINNNILYDRKIQDLAKVLGAISPIITKYNLDIAIYTKDEWYVNKLSDNIFSEKKLTESPSPKYIKNFDKIYNLKAYKILLITNEESLTERLKNKIEKVFQEIGLTNSIKIYQSKSKYIEITDFLATKGIALRHIMNKFRIDRNNTMAIGDSYVDLTMKNYVGIFVTLNNAPEDLKKMADFVTKSNDEDGVYYAIKSVI